MRFFLAGFICLWLSVAAWGQVRGEVESIGFQNHYRPDCWTPMVVSVTPETSEDATYIIQIEQRDSDGDRVVYTSPITVTGVREGMGTRSVKKEVYFIPKATTDPGFDRGGLVDSTDPGGLKFLQSQLKVFIATEAGKQIAQVPIGASIQSIDPEVPPMAATRGKKLVLAVSDPNLGSQPSWKEYEGILAVNEEVLMVNLRPRELPESILGYDAVDAVVFLNADPDDLKTPTDERMRALRQWVREGGNLVICQSPQWELTLRFGDLLPVTLPRFGTGPDAIQGVAEKHDRPPLYEMMMESVPARATTLERSTMVTRIEAGWRRARPPFKLGLAEARPGAHVLRWIDWPTKPGEPPLRTPYIVRDTYGMGSVTWVAQDLGDPAVSAIPHGWPGVWERVFGWNNWPYTPDPNIKDEDEPLTHAFLRTSGVDLGESLLAGMEHGRKGAGLIFMVVFFFIAYWVAAGPVSYLFLANKRKTHLSWFAFTAAAGVATMLTAGVVELVLRGDPEIRHISFVRLAPRAPTLVESRIGLYIPRDGPQTIALTESEPGSVSYITPFAYHPQHIKQDIKFTTVLRYEVPVPSPSDITPPSVEIPYRTTLKKLQAKWTGNSSAAILGEVRLLEGMNYGGICRLDGRVTNATPHNLSDVYFAFVDHAGYDAICYVPAWNAGQTIDFQSLTWHAIGTANEREAMPRSNRAIADRMQRHFGAHDRWLTEYLLVPSWRSVHEWDDSGQLYSHSLPVLSLYNRIAPVPNPRQQLGRYEILRRNARHLDMSHIVAAGDLAIFAVAAGVPLPLPFTVEGEAVESRGDILYQAVLPLDRSELPDPTTRPADDGVDVEGSGQG